MLKVKLLFHIFFYIRRVENKSHLESLYKKSLTKEESNWIKEQMVQTKALEDSINLAKQLGLEAIEAVKDEDNDSLIQIMNAMII